MIEPMIPLEYHPTVEDFRAVKDAAARECECTNEMRLVYKETKVSCKPCAARLLCNGLSTLSEEL